MVNKKRGVIFGIFFLLIFMSFSFVSSELSPDVQCYMKSSPTASCDTGYYDNGNSMCCVNVESECAPHNPISCDDGDLCTNDYCVLATQNAGYTGEDYYVCYNSDKCSGQECDATTGTCYDSGYSTFCEPGYYSGGYGGCSGSWEEESHCSGTWYECVSDSTGGGAVTPDGIETMSFFSILTGKVVSFFGGEATITGQPVQGDYYVNCGYCNTGETCEQFDCYGANYDDCYYQDNNKDGGEGCEWVSSQEILCSDQGYSESECEDNPYCTPVYDCLPKKDNCGACTSNEQCKSNKCMFDLINNKRVCVPGNTVCVNSDLTNFGCGVYVHETFCYDDDTVYICEIDESGNGYWDDDTCTYRCSGGICNECTSGTKQCSVDGKLQTCVDGFWNDGTDCEYVCEDGACVSPVAYWTEEGQPKSSFIMDGFSPYVTVNLHVTRANLLGCFGSTCTLNIYNSSNGLVDSVAATVSEGVISEEWNFTSEHLENVSLNSDGSGYELYFEEVGDNIQSGIVKMVPGASTCKNGFCESGESTTCPDDCAEHCSNGFWDQELEEGVDCGGDDCPACETQRFWLDSNNQMIDDKILDIDKLKDGDYEFKMFLQNADAEGSTFFSLKEEDGVWGDDSIGGFDGTVDNNNLIASWIPTMYDMIAAGEEEDNPEFYFEVQGDASNGLIFSFQEDGGDIDFPSCNDNTMNGDEEGVDCGGSCYEYYGEEKTCPPTVCDGVATCGNYGTEGDCTRNECLELDEGATCSWNESSGKCNEVKSYFFGDFEIGQCIYDEDTSGDNCDDGFLSYDITANWEWGGESGFFNSYINKTACENAVGGECIQGVDNLWHYDPEGVNKECISMNSVIPCPAQIELSFFNWKNFFAAALLILIIYVILRNSKTLKKMEEKHKSPVKSSKKSSKKKVSKKNSPTKKKSTKKKSSKKKSSKKK